MYSSSSTSSSSSTTSSTTMTKYNRHHHSTALQSLVRTKCWSIAPLWKFVTYELEQQGPISKGLQRSASVRANAKKPRRASLQQQQQENDPAMLRGLEGRPTGGRKVPILSKPHPHQSLKLVNHQQPSRQPLQQANRINDAVVGLPPKIPKPSTTSSQISIEVPNNDDNNEWKPCGVLKKPGSYRGHASLKKVAFLENTELNRSTL